MDFWKVLLLFAAAVAAAAVDAAAVEAAAVDAAADDAAVNVTRKVGDDVTLSLGRKLLKPGDMVVWSYGPKTGEENVLFSIDIGSHDKLTQRDQFELDLTTGALTIKNLSANDSAVYCGQIFNGNGTKRFFNLTVKGPDPIQPIQPIQPTAESQQHANTWIIICVVVVFIFILIVICSLIAFIVKKKKICRDDTMV